MTDSPTRPAAAGGAHRYSVSQLSLPHTTTREDLDLLTGLGIPGIGIWEGKLTDVAGAELHESIASRGMTATLCLPTIWSFLNSRLSPEPSSPRERLDSLLAGMERMAPLEPVCVYVTSGALGDREESEARKIVESGLATVADRALELGLNVGFEPIRRSSGGIYADFDDSFELIDEVGRPNLWFVFDVWHLWDIAGLEEKIARYAARTIGVQVNDWREDTRGWCDRTYPGAGVANVARIVSAFEASGYQGWYDLELLSDDGTRGTRYPDSLWALDPAEMLKEARDGFLAAWPARAA